ncbi:hypothetical protein [Wenjunlia vitaminophila]|uniref:hypothetical protein n=1 Tax=Wenjunlia vitaminophila TaxID=76728 RepID=UPI00035F8A4A|nr:hypothetical protein [Wenjunlia vitaminophila]
MARVQVMRVAGMPHNTELLVLDDLDCYEIYVDAALPAERVSALVEQALNTSVARRYWERVDDPLPRPPHSTDHE